MVDNCQKNELLKFLRGGPVSYTAGIGSRKLPSSKSETLFKAAFISVLTDRYGYSSGGAGGSDATIEHGVKAALQLISSGPEYVDLVNQYLNVYLPFPYFNGRSASQPGMIDAQALPKAPQAQDLAKSIHPATQNKKTLSSHALAFHSRNGHQVLGVSLDTPVRSILCFTGDGAKKGASITQKTGGTGQALRLADKFGVPVVNIGNRADEAAIQRWIESRSKHLLAKYGIDVDEAHHEYVSNYTAGIHHHVGDLVEDSDSLNLDLIVHECNCFNTMDSEVALSIKNKFYDAYLADQHTVKGDRKKLGTFTSADCPSGDRKVTVINAYTQYKHGQNNDLHFDYDAFKDILKRLNSEHPGARVGFPRIGSNGAGACWLTIAEMINVYAPRLNPVVVSRPTDLEYKPERQKNRDHSGGQIGMDL